MTFQVGDKVIYPNHGLGVVQGIETKTILGTTCGFYHLRMVANETTVLVPVDNVDGVGLRRAINDEEIERLFSLLGDGKIDNHQNWKGRFKDNSDRMRTGSIYDVVEVLKSLTFLARSKNLSFREKRMLDRAKFLVISEISEVSREKSDSIEAQGRHRPRALLHDEEPLDRPRQGRQGGADDARLGAPDRQGVVTALGARRRKRLHTGREPQRFPAFFWSRMIVIRSLLTYVLRVALYVLIVGPPLVVVIAFLTGNPAMLYRVGHLGVRLGLALSGIRTGSRVSNTCSGTARRSTPSTMQATSNRPSSSTCAERAVSAAADPLQGGAAQAAGARSRVRPRRVRAAASAGTASRACRRSTAPRRRSVTATRF